VEGKGKRELWMPEQRRVVSIGSSGRVEVQREAVPALKPGEILVKVGASLVSSGTELGPYIGRDRVARPDERFRSFGYQNAGVVTAVGDGVKGFHAGQRVACMGAGYALHTDFAVVPQNLAVAIPDAVSDEEGAFAALAATAMHAVRRGDVVFGENALVLGMGILGQVIAQVARAAGARVLALDLLPLRLERARSAGIERTAALSGDEAVRWTQEQLEGDGADCAFICFGGDATGALKDAVRMMKVAPDTHRWGRIVIVGGATVTHGFGADLGNLDLRSAARTGAGYHDDAYEHGSDYPGVFVRWSTQAHLELFVRWVQEGKLRLRELITDRAPVTEAAEACYGIMDHPGEHLGVLITY